MAYVRPNFELDRGVSRAGAIREALRIVEQHLLLANVDQQRRQTFEIRVERRGPRILGIGRAQIIFCYRGDDGAAKHRAAMIIDEDGIARGGEIGPGRKQRAGGGQRIAQIAQRDHKGEREQGRHLSERSARYADSASSSAAGNAHGGYGGRL